MVDDNVENEWLADLHLSRLARTGALAEIPIAVRGVLWVVATAARGPLLVAMLRRLRAIDDARVAGVKKDPAWREIVTQAVRLQGMVDYRDDDDIERLRHVGRILFTAVIAPAQAETLAARLRAEQKASGARVGRLPDAVMKCLFENAPELLERNHSGFVVSDGDIARTLIAAGVMDGDISSARERVKKARQRIRI